MKKILIILFLMPFTSCSNLSSDAQEVCELMTETKEILPKIMEVGMQSAFGNEDSTKELEELQSKAEAIGAKVEAISSKYDEDEFQSYLLENCEVAKELKELGEAFEEVGEGLEELIEDID